MTVGDAAPVLAGLGRDVLVSTAVALAGLTGPGGEVSFDEARRVTGELGWTLLEPPYVYDTHHSELGESASGWIVGDDFVTSVGCQVTSRVRPQERSPESGRFFAEVFARHVEWLTEVFGPPTQRETGQVSSVEWDLGPGKAWVELTSGRFGNDFNVQTPKFVDMTTRAGLVDGQLPPSEAP